MVHGKSHDASAQTLCTDSPEWDARRERRSRFCSAEQVGLRWPKRDAIPEDAVLRELPCRSFGEPITPAFDAPHAPVRPFRRAQGRKRCHHLADCAFAHSACDCLSEEMVGQCVDGAMRPLAVADEADHGVDARE